MKRNLVANKRIAIIGGGPVGLTTARLLQMKGVVVKVYERDKHADARIAGGTLDLHPSTGQNALKKAGLLAEFHKHARPMGQKAADMKGNIIFSMKPDKSKPEIDRPALRRILLNSLNANTVVWDCQFVSMEKKQEAFVLNFQDGSCAEADLVIIADGTMSKARRYITDTLPEETGTYVIQGEIENLKASCPNLSALALDSNLAIVEDKKSIFFHVRNDGSVSLHVSFRKTEQWTKETVFDFSDTSSIKHFLYELFKDWNPVYRELFDASKAYNGFPFRVFNVHEIKKPHSMATVVGDAAHVMPPWGGMGVNMGMKDAVILTENLTEGNFKDVKSAIDDYESKMIAYAAPIQRETHGADDRIHSQYENSMTGFKQRLLLRILKGVQFIALLALLLVTGVFWGNWFSLSRSFEVFSVSELSHIAKALVNNLAIPMRIISIMCLVLISLTVWLIPQKRSQEFYVCTAALVFIAVSLVLTVVIEVPINNQIVTWTASLAPPNWQTIRDRWQLVNCVRTICALCSFGLFAFAILKPFERRFGA